MKARDIMTTNPDVVTPNDSISRAAQIMRDSDVGIVPVVDADGGRRLRGVITDRDIAVRHVAEQHQRDCTVEHHMSTRVSTVSPDDDAEKVMNLMRSEQVRRIPVVENGDQLLGIIAQADIATDIKSGEQVARTVEGISQPAHPSR